MADMMKMYASSGMGFGGDFGKEGQTLVLNAKHPLVKYLSEHADEDKNETCTLIERQLYDLAQIQNAPLEAEEMKYIAV